MIHFSELRDTWKGVLAFTAALVLQPFLHGLFPSWQTPNILLTLTAALVMVYADYRLWIVMGIIYALLQDAVFGIFTGIGAISTIVVVAMVLILRRFFNCRSAVVALMISVLVTLVYAFVYWGLGRAVSSPYPLTVMLRTMPAQLIENTIVFMLIYWRLSEDERGRNLKNWYVQ